MPIYDELIKISEMNSDAHAGYIDGPQDINPVSLREYAKSVRYAGRDHVATVLEWCADIFENEIKANKT